MNRGTELDALVALLFAVNSDRPTTRRPHCKCALPGCERLTSHNGGYCCRDHCHQHRASARGSAKACSPNPPSLTH